MDEFCLEDGTDNFSKGRVGYYKLYICKRYAIFKIYEQPQLISSISRKYVRCN